MNPDKTPSPDQPQPEKPEKKTEPPERPPDTPPPSQNMVSRRDMLFGIRKKLSGLTAENDNEEVPEAPKTKPSEDTTGGISRRKALQEGGKILALVTFLGLGTLFGGRREKKPQIDTSSPDKLMETFPDKIPGGSVEKIEVPGAKRVIFAVKQLHPSLKPGHLRSDLEKYAQDKYDTQSVQNDIYEILNFLQQKCNLKEIFTEGTSTEGSTSFFQQYDERLAKEIEQIMTMMSEDKEKMAQLQRWINNPNLYKSESPQSATWAGKPYDKKMLRKKLKAIQNYQERWVRSIDKKRYERHTDAINKIAKEGILRIKPAESKEIHEKAVEDPSNKDIVHTQREDYLFKKIDQEFQSGKTSHPFLTSFIFGGAHDMPAALKRFNKKSKTQYSMIYITPTTYPEEEKK